MREGDIGAPTGAGTFDRAFGPVVVSGSRLSPFGAVEKRPDGDRARQPPVHCGERERRFGSVRPRHQHIGTAMITLASGTRVWLAVGRTDMRKVSMGSRHWCRRSWLRIRSAAARLCFADVGLQPTGLMGWMAPHGIDVPMLGRQQRQQTGPVHERGDNDRAGSGQSSVLGAGG